jgi:hypothetical protein
MPLTIGSWQPKSVTVRKAVTANSSNRRIIELPHLFIVLPIFKFSNYVLSNILASTDCYASLDASAPVEDTQPAWILFRRVFTRSAYRRESFAYRQPH